MPSTATAVEGFIMGYFCPRPNAFPTQLAHPIVPRSGRLATATIPRSGRLVGVTTETLHSFALSHRERMEQVAAPRWDTFYAICLEPFPVIS